ncbi:hypothetical protein N9E30_03975 [Flavobacteriales bacterium]|nr:hypothetical protein [Flavobacteriales bacterium]
MKNLILTLIITLPLTLWGQGWEQTFGGEDEDYGNSVQQTTDGGYIITGYTYSFGNGDIDVYLIKTDENGNEIWNKTFGGEYNDIGYSVQQTTDGGYIITGYTQNDNMLENANVYLIKTDENGNEQWSQTFDGIDGDCGYSVQQTTDGGYIIVGNTSITYNLGYSYVYIIKTDENGNEQWSQTFGGEDCYNYGYSVQQTNDGGYIITGFTCSFGNGGYDIYLIKTDENGNEVWNKTFGGEGSEFGYSVQQTTDGGYILVGNTNSLTITLEEYEVELVYLIKTDGNGNEQWAQTFAGGFFSDYGNGYSVQQTNDGGYIITGQTTGGTFGTSTYDVYLIKTDENGNELWSQTLGGEGVDDLGRSVQQTTDGGYIIVGNTNNANGDDVYLIKTDGYGNILPYESIISGCDSVQNSLTNNYINENGIYIDTLTNVFGGDSVVIQEIEIFNSPENIVIEGNNEVISSTLETYQITINPNNSIEWNVEGETISEVNGNTIEVLWGDEGIGYVEITETDTNGCSTTSTLEVTISNEPTNIYEYNTTRKLIKTINLLGQEIKPQKNQSYIEIFDDGTRKRKIIIE